MAKRKKEKTLADVLYLTTFQQMQSIVSAGQVEIDLTNPDSNGTKGYNQLAYINKANPFATFTAVDGIATVKALDSKDGKANFAKILKIGKAKFEPSLQL